VIVVGGFWVLVLSQFLPTAYFGALIGVTMLGALACNLFLLPMLMLFVRPIVGRRGLEARSR
jgi:predicted RND superfamily exporter protein